MMTRAETEKVEPDSDFGAVLADARKAKNKTVDDASEYLKIPAPVITAIENSDVSALPPPTFSQGYIRAYARYLNIEEQKVLEMYNLAMPHELATELKSRSKLPAEANSQSPLVKTITIALIIAGITAVIYGSFDYYQKKADVMESQLESRQQSFTGSSLNSPASQSGSLRLPIKQSTEPAEDGALVVDDTADSSPGAEDEESLSETPVIAEESDSSAETAKKPDDVVEIFAENGAWLEVYDASEKRLFYNMLNKGKSKTLTGQSPFRIALGNAGSTKITINDVKLDMRGFIRSNNTASFMVDVSDGKATLY
jgi:cytoskeleton protein RodZ